MSALSYYRGAERPTLRLWLLDDDGALVDLSSSTLVFRIGVPGETAILEKTTGVAGAAGAGSEPDGTPNAVVTWAADDLDIVPGVYSWRLIATASGLDRVFGGQFRIDPAID